MAVYRELASAPPPAPIPPREREVWRASLKAVYVIWYRDLLRYRRERVRVITSLVQPLLFLFVFGVGLRPSVRGATGTPGQPSGDYLQFVYPGIVAMPVVFISVFSAMSIIWDREFGFLKEILVAPVRRSAVAVGKTLGGTTRGTIQGGLMLVAAPFVGVHLGILGSAMAMLELCVLAFALAAAGVALAARMRSLQSFPEVTNFLVLPLFFLSGALFPLTTDLPRWLVILTRLDPVSYAVAALRHTMTSNASRGLEGDGISVLGWGVPTSGSLALLVIFGMVMVGLAIRGFRVPD